MIVKAQVKKWVSKNVYVAVFEVGGENFYGTIHSKYDKYLHALLVHPDDEQEYPLETNISLDIEDMETINRRTGEKVMYKGCLVARLTLPDYEVAPIIPDKDKVLLKVLVRKLAPVSSSSVVGGADSDNPF